VFERLLPLRADNAYSGHQAALWLFGLLTAIRLVMSLNSMVNGRVVATSADGIPLETFTPSAAQTVVSLFALLALSRLVLSVAGIVVLVRYRTLVPLMFGLLLLEQFGRALILRVMPIPRTGAPPGSVINLVLLCMVVVGLALSLRRSRHASAVPWSELPPRPET
jgi:hypothetical protein